MRWISFDSVGAAMRTALPGFLALLLSCSVHAHTPHDIITDIAVAPSQSGEGRAFIIITDQVFRSDHRNSSWKNLDNGLDIQHGFTALAMSPNFATDDTVYVATSGDGIFRSQDGGDSWHRFNKGLTSLRITEILAIEESDDGNVLLAAAADGGLWRRADNTDSWQQALSRTVRVTAFTISDNGSDRPVALAGDSAGRLWRSQDGGRLWTIAAQLDGVGMISSVASNGQDVYVGTGEGGLYRSSDGARSLTRVSSFSSKRTHDCSGQVLENAVADSHITSVSLWPGPGRGVSVFVTTWYNGAHFSTDNGDTWSAWDRGLSCNRQADSEGLPHFGEIEIEMVTEGPPVFWLAAFDGLFRSTQMSDEWHQLETLPLGMIKGFAVHQSSDEDPTVALATYGGGFYLTRDLGQNWTIGNQGLATTRLTGIAFSQDYAEDESIYAGSDQRLLISSDRGESWNRVMLQQYGVGAKIGLKLSNWGAPKALSGLFYDPRDHARVYPTHIVPQEGPNRDQVLFATRFTGVMQYDRLSGEISTVWGGTNRIMNTFMRSPGLESDKTLFASIRGEGLFRSTDAGISWAPINNGLEFVDAWAKEPGGTDFRRDVQLAISPRFDSDGTLFAGSAAASGLYETTDGGNTWRQTGLLPDLASVPVLAIAVSPDFAIDDTLIASTRGHGLFRSEDRGASFEPVGRDLLQKNASIEYLAFSRNYGDDALVLAASDEEFYVSRDRGRTWRAVDRPVRHEDMRSVVRFSGDWTQRLGEEFSAMTETTTSVADARVRLEFLGNGIRWIGSMGPGNGNARVFVDGKLIETVETRADHFSVQEELFSITNLDYGVHTIEVISGDGRISVDAFDVLSVSRPAH